ncbi:MAG: hypothetical protein R8P61_05355 [Bacteroidia bacterium]|nr:hypothetical protein [Bacteroidia bacterium]
MQTIKLGKRQEFIQELFKGSRKLRYAYLKYFYPTQYHIPEKSDIDLIIDKKEIREWKRLIQDSNYVKRVRFREKSFALYAEIFFEDGSFLEMDLIHACKWKFNVFLQTEEILEFSNLNLEGIKIASLQHSFAYLSLFYTLNSSEIPQKYIDFYHQLDGQKKAEVRQYIQTKYQLEELGDNIFDLLPHRKKLIARIQNFSDNQGWTGLLLKASSFRDRLKDPGMVITFSGVDGAGKSTILEETRKILAEKYRKEIVLLRQRPSILPILSSYKYGKQEAEQKAANTLPRTGTNKSKISSFVRFMYYYCDYVLGQFYVYLKHSLKGHIILYDRYYFDYIVDSKRANIVLPPAFIKALYRFVFKPDLNVLLYADPELILARKQELSAEDIRKLTTDFKALFGEFDRKHKASTYLLLNNVVLEESLESIENAYLEIAGEESEKHD